MPRFPTAIAVEQGSPGGMAGSGFGIGGTYSGGLYDNAESTTELRWPHNVAVYDRMRNDGQVAASLRAILLPIRRRVNWRLGREGCDPRVLAAVEATLGLTPTAVARVRRQHQGIVWGRYLRESLTCKLVFGHHVSEQVYAIGPPLPELAARGLPPLMAHIDRLSPRPARTIAGWEVNNVGQLEAVHQHVVVYGPGGWGGWQDRRLAVDRLVVHVLDMEGADWTGRSLLRASYPHYLIKDILMRVGAAAVERNGMGVPVVTFDVSKGATRSKALDLGRSFRAGDDAALALPEGYTITLLGMSGTVRDELPLLRYHDEAIGKNALTMMLDLGHDAGARSLGNTFLELFTMGCNTIASEYAEEVTEYVIRDFVRLNFGDDEPYPPLLVDELSPAQVLTAADLASLVTAGVIIPDDELELEVRRRNQLPTWPMAPEGEPDFTVDDVSALPPGPPAPPALPPAPPAPPPPPASAWPEAGPGRRVALRADDELHARLAAVHARIAARAAAR